MSTVSTERLQILVDFADEIQPLLETVGEAIHRLLKRPGDVTAATVGLDQLQTLQGACLLMELDGFGALLDGAREVLETLSGAPALAASQRDAGRDFAALLEREGKALGKTEAPSNPPAELAEVMARLRTSAVTAAPASAPAPLADLDDDLDAWLDTLSEIKPGWLDSLAAEEDERAPTLPFETGQLSAVDDLTPAADSGAAAAAPIESSDPEFWTEEVPVVRPLLPVEELPAPISAEKATKELDELWHAWGDPAAPARHDDERATRHEDAAGLPLPARDGFGRPDFAAAAAKSGDDEAALPPAAELRPTSPLDDIDFDSLLESMELDYARPETSGLGALTIAEEADEPVLAGEAGLAPAGVGNDEALAVFATERVRLLTALSQARAELAANPDDEAALMNLTWATHTLRGAANLVGAELIGDVCQLMKRAADRLEAQGAEARADVLPFLDLAERALHELIDAGYPTAGFDVPTAAASVSQLTALYAEIDDAAAPATSGGGWDYLPPEIAAELEGMNIDELDEATLARVAALLDAHDAARAGTAHPISAASSPAATPEPRALTAAAPGTDLPVIAIDDSAEFSDDELAALLDGAAAAMAEPIAPAVSFMPDDAADFMPDGTDAIETAVVETGAAETDLTAPTPVELAVAKVEDLTETEAAPEAPTGEPVALSPIDFAGGKRPDFAPTTVLRPTDPTTLLGSTDPTTLLQSPEPTTLLGPADPTTLLRSPEPTTILGPLLGDDDRWAWAPPEAPAATQGRQPTGMLEPTDDATFEAELRAVFMAEAEEHLATINRALLALDRTAADEHHMQEVRRAVHTLKGSSAAVGIDTIADFCHVWEDALDAAAEGAASPVTELSLLLECTEALERYVRHPDEFNAALELAPLVRRMLGVERRPAAVAEPEAVPAGASPDAATGLGDTLTELDSEPEIAEVAPLAGRLDLPAPALPALPALVDDYAAFDWSPPEPAVAAVDDGIDAEFEAELRAVFMAEAEEHLATINRALLALETSPNDPAHMREVRRAVHTLKGSSAAVGIDTIADFCHVWEDALDAAAEGAASPVTELSLLLECTEALERYVRHPDEFSAAVELTPLARRITSGAPEPAPAEVQTADTLADVTEAAAELPAAPAEGSAPDADVAETVRVTAEIVATAAAVAETMPAESPAETADAAGTTEVGSVPAVSVEPASTEAGTPTGSVGEAKTAPAMPAPRDEQRLKPEAVAAFDAQTDPAQAEPAPAVSSTPAPANPGALPVLLVPEAAPLAPAASIEPSSLRSMFARDAAPIPPTEAARAPRAAVPDAGQAMVAGGADMLRVPLARIDALIGLVGELVVQRSGLVERLERLGGGIGDLEPSIQRLRRLGIDLEDRFGYFADFRGPVPGAATAGGVAGEWDELEFDRYGEAYQLSRDLAELAQDLETTRRELGQLYDDAQLAVVRQGRTASGLHDELLGLRLVPLAQLLPRLQRTVRQAALKSGKDVTFLMEGGETQLDKTLLEEIADPLLHLLRNSVDHGIEAAAERQLRGKPAQGTIKIVSFREAGEVVVQVWDDGAGIDPARVLAKARSRGIIPRETPDDPALAYDVIFAPGFSTAATVTDLSGRGVGLDVVRAALTRAKGTVSVTSQPGEGTVFTLRVPALLVVAPALVVTAGKQRLAIPLANVRHVRRSLPDQLVGVGDARLLSIDGQMLPVRQLATVLGLGEPSAEEAGSLNLIVVAVGDRQAAVVVDDIIGQQETVIKAPAPPFDVLPGLSGVSLQGNGEVLLVLNPLELLPAPELRSRAGRFQALAAVPQATTLSDDEVEGGQPLPTIGAPDEVPTVLVVDDSLSVRRVVTRTLERHGWRVRQARDGVEALEEVRQLAPHVLLVDIEMPRMDGFELAGTLKKQSLHQHLPIVMLTSRGGEKHRTKAFDIGVDGYLVKPYQEAELVRVLREVALSFPAGAA